MKTNVTVGVLMFVLGMCVSLSCQRTPPVPRAKAQEGRSAAAPPAVRSGKLGPAAAPGLPSGDAGPWAGARPSGTEPAPLEDFTPEERVNIGVYETANRSVVNITTKAARPDAFLMFEVPLEGAGSGSVLDKEGHILTNFHVIEGAQSIMVTLFNGEAFEAGLVGQDPDNDIAVLRISASPELLYPLFPGDSNRLRVGQRVFALGNPFGLERTLTVGTLSSLNRSLPARTGRTMKSIIQVDAALNRGNSGGPLLDSHGRLIGMNTAIASPTGGNTGVGFAIPINTIRRVVPQLLQNGRVIRPETGVVRVYETEKGLIIASLLPGGPAEQAGLRGFRVVRQKERRGPFVYEETRVDRQYADMIVAVDGKKVRSADDFLDALESKRPGEVVQVHIVREGREMVVPLTLGTSEA